MDGGSQLVIPESFLDLHRDARRRLTIARDEALARYELCEDMAQLLVERSQIVLHDQGLSEDIVLSRTRDGLAGAESGFSPDEAGWITTRLAELLDWPWAGRPTPEPPPWRC